MGGAGSAGAAPPETAESAKIRVSREFDAADKASKLSALSLQRQHKVVDRAEELLAKMQVEAVEADDRRIKVVAEMYELWGGGGGC